MMNCDGDNCGPITRRRAKAIRLLGNMRGQNIEMSQQSTCAVSFEAQGTSGNQNDKTGLTKRTCLVNQENNTLASEPNKTSDTNLLNILDNLICRNHILSFLQVNDLLRLRRVCKSAKESSQDFIRTRKVSTQEPLKIDVSHKTSFKKFNEFYKVSNPLPTRTALRLTFTDRRYIPKAPTRCTDNITHLALVCTELPLIKQATLNFLESFPNVTHLVLDHYYVAKGFSTNQTIKIPEIFRNLKSLKFMSHKSITLRFWRPNNFIYLQKIVEACISNLEHISLPLHQFLRGNQLSLVHLVALACLCIFSETNLKIEGVTGELTNELLRIQSRTSEMRGRDQMIKHINAKIVSIDMPDREVFLQELPNLEKINFEIIENNVIPFPRHAFSRSSWSKLKEIRVDFHKSNATHRRLWDFLFVNIVRENVVELHISFTGLKRDHNMSPTCTRTSDILTSCPNLKILYFKSLDWQPLDLPLLWRGLPRLEKLYFVECNNLMDKDFIGTDSAKPALWELKNLQVLELTRMNLMDVTNDLFSKVVCQIPLRELHLSCCKYRKHVAKSLTLEGLESLLGGKFASTVERLSFKNLMIRDVTREELKSLESRFRSSQMY